METGFCVRDVMTNKPITVQHDIPITDVAQALKNNNVNSVLVLDGEQLVGIITDEDIVWNVVAASRNVADVLAFDVMRKDILSIDPDKDIYQALTMMRDNSIRQLPVLERGNLEGFITLKDILKIQPELFDIIAEKFELRNMENRPAFSIDHYDGNCSICGNYSKKLVRINSQFVCPLCR